MVVCERRKRSAVQTDIAAAAHDGTDAGEGERVELSGNANTFGHGEEKLVFFAAMKRLIEAGSRKAGWLDNVGVDARGNA